MKKKTQEIAKKYRTNAQRLTYYQNSLFFFVDLVLKTLKKMMDLFLEC
jgi:hypothetical protein